MIELLIKHGTSINEVSNWGWNILQCAAFGGHVEAFHKLVLHYGINLEDLADIEKWGWDIISLMAMQHFLSHSLKFYRALNSNRLSFVEIKEILIGAGSDRGAMFLQWPIMAGKTPLFWACKNNNFALATLFVQLGVPFDGLVNFLKNDTAKDCFHLALARCDHQDAILAILNNQTLIQNLTKRFYAKNDPYVQTDMNIIMNGLIGGHLMAGPRKVSLENIIIGGPNTNEELEKTRQTILCYAAALDNEGIALKYAEILTAQGNGMGGTFMGKTVSGATVSECLLIELTSRLQKLTLEKQALQNELDHSKVPQETHVNPVTFSFGSNLKISDEPKNDRHNVKNFKRLSL